MTGCIINPYVFATGGGTPSSIEAWAVQSDFTVSGGRLTGITPSLGTMSTTVFGSGPEANTTNGIDTGTITAVNYWQLNTGSDAWFDGSHNMMMVYEVITAETGVLLDQNSSNYLGAFQSGAGTAPNGGGSVGMGDRFRANGTDVLTASGTRDDLYTAMDAGTTGVDKWVALRTPSTAGTSFRPMQYPLDLAFTPDVWLKAIVFYSDWAETDDVATFILGEIV